MSKSSEKSSEKSPCSYCVTINVAVAPSDAVTVMVDVRVLPPLTEHDTVSMFPETKTVSHVSIAGRLAVHVTTGDNPDIVTVFAIHFSFFREPYKTRLSKIEC